MRSGGGCLGSLSKVFLHGVQVCLLKGKEGVGLDGRRIRG